METINNPIEEVRQALDEQVQTWNAGNLEKALSWYWNDPEMLWISRSGISKGFGPARKIFQEAFVNGNRMGTYTYELLSISELSPSTIFYVFKWTIEHHDKRLMGAISSQVWKKLNGQWVITAEHASY